MMQHMIETNIKTSSKVFLDIDMKKVQVSVCPYLHICS